MDFLTLFAMSFIPIMVAMNAPSVLPIYITLTEDLGAGERKKIVRQSVFTAFIITVLFIFLGKAIFNALEILIEDFMIAGGILLLIISIVDILRFGERKLPMPSTIGAVPLGTPLIAGPATLTTTLILAGNYGYAPVIASLIVNILLAWIIFDKAEALIKIMGINGARAFAKVASLLLAAIAVKLIRLGITRIVE
jgi:multiple antibiotic resistance protein